MRVRRPLLQHRRHQQILPQHKVVGDGFQPLPRGNWYSIYRLAGSPVSAACRAREIIPDQTSRMCSSAPPHSRAFSLRQHPPRCGGKPSWASGPRTGRTAPTAPDQRRGLVEEAQVIRRQSYQGRYRHSPAAPAAELDWGSGSLPRCLTTGGICPPTAAPGEARPP